MNSTVLLKDLQLNMNQSGGRGGGKDGEKPKLSKRFDDLGIPVGFLSNNRKNKPHKQPPNNEDGENEPVITDKMMNYFINKVLP
jgi:hypothetical protein